MFIHNNDAIYPQFFNMAIAKHYEINFVGSSIEDPFNCMKNAKNI